MRKNTVFLSILVFVCLTFFVGCNGLDLSFGPAEPKDECEHVYGEWIVDQEPTRTEDGRKHRDCTVCGETIETDGIPAIGSADLSYTINTDGTTCTVTGIGKCTDTQLYIPQMIDGYRVNGIGDYAFQHCDDLISVQIAENDQLKNIGEGAFFWCTGLVSVTISEGITNIGASAFYNCEGLTSISIPNSVTFIGEQAFHNCRSLTYGEYNNGRYLGNSKNPYVVLMDVEDATVTEVTIYPRTRVIYDGALAVCSNLTSIVIPDGVTHIGNSAFYACNRLADITIPDSVISISDYAFDGCPSLVYTIYNNGKYLGNSKNPYVVLIGLVDKTVVDFTIPDSTGFVYKYALLDCKALTDIKIPQNVRNIGISAFSGCSGLTGATFADSSRLTHVSQGAFAGCGLLENILLPEGVTSIGAAAFRECEALTSFIIPSSVTSVGDSAFFGCGKLASVTIPNNITSIGNDAFERCINLESVYITDIASWCTIRFGGPSANPLYYADFLYLNESPITDLVIPKGVTSIEDDAFSDYTDLTSISLPDGLTSIGYRSFYCCYKPTSIIIPGSVTTIKEEAFFSWNKLSTVYYEGTAGDWDDISIDLGNDCLTSATRYYYSEAQPSDTTYQYWHYVDGVPTVW